MYRLFLSKFYPALFCSFLLWVPTFSHAELLLPAEEVLIAHVAGLEEVTLYAQLDDEALYYGESGFEDDEFGPLEGIPDPLEPWNRFWFGFNDKFYFWIFKPVAQGYEAVVPTGARIGIRNFFHNLAMPVRFINALLQGKPKIAGYEFGRFFINSSVGLAGWFDVASREPELRSYDEDLGQTFGVWGIGHGFYFVWPILGASSLRDTVGSVGDGFMNPVNYVGLWAPTGTVYGVRTFEYTNDGSFRIGDYEDLKEAAVDPYISLRDAYYQRRKAEVAK